MPSPGSGPASHYDILDEANAHGAPFQDPAQELDPAAVLAPEEREGKGFRVRSIRYGPGLLYIYSIETKNGTIEAQGRGRLRKRIREIQTLEALREADVRDRDVYALALANAAEAPAEGGMQLIFHPIETTTNIPKGIWAMARGYYEMTEAGRTYLEDDYFHELIGFGKAKREWAYRIGVDPYSSNPQLQAALDRLAWLSLAGGMSVRLPLMAVPGGASIALTVTNTSDDMKRELRDETPEEIRIQNRATLLDTFGVDEADATSFVEHPWYSPSAQLEIVDTLSAMDGVENKRSFIELSLLVDTPAEAYSFTRLAIMFQAFHEHIEVLEEFISADGFIAARTRKGDFVLPLNIDFGYWTQGAAQLVETIDDEIRRRGDIRRKYTLVSGVLSSQARDEVERRGWTIVEDIEATWLKEFDAQAFAPAEPDPERILPEIGS